MSGLPGRIELVDSVPDAFARLVADPPGRRRR